VGKEAVEEKREEGAKNEAERPRKDDHTPVESLQGGWRGRGTEGR
jgi:hypothetical protein